VQNKLLTDRDAIWGTGSCGFKEPYITWGQDQTNSFAAAMPRTGSGAWRGSNVS